MAGRCAESRITDRKLACEQSPVVSLAVRPALPSRGCAGARAHVRNTHSGRRVQRRVRMENERYLREHPELTTISKVLMAEVLKEAPEDPVKFVAEFMTQDNLKARVLKAAGTVGVSM